MFSLRACKLISAALTLLALLFLGSSQADAQGLLGLPKSLSAVGSELPQSQVIDTIAASSTCSSISSLSRRCHFTFDAECKKRGESKGHCIRMAGFCHACTDAYATCKSGATASRGNSSSTNCGICNVAYGRCIERMVKQYGGSLVKAQ